MNKNIILFCMLASLVILGFGCKDSQLEDFGFEQTESVKVSASGKTPVIIKEKSKVFVELEVLLSGAAGNAFEIDLKEYRDTISQLVENGTLENVVILPVGSYEIPNVANVTYGTKKTTFRVSLDVATLGKNFGRKVAFAVKMATPSKGNAVYQSKETFVVVLDTKDILSIEEIRYINFVSNTDKVINIPTGTNYSVTPAGLVIPITLKLNGAGESVGFNVTMGTDPLAIPALVAEGKLPASTIAIADGSYTFNPLVKFLPGQNTARFEVAIPMTLLSANATKKLAISINLLETSKNLVNPDDNTVIVLIDPSELVLVDGTNDAGTIFSVSKDNNSGPYGNEGSMKLIDGNVNTKMFVGSVKNIWMQLQFPVDKPAIVRAYELTSGNDEPGRDAKKWNLSASNDGIKWVVLDEREAQVFNDRKLTRRFDFTNNVAYTYYRLNVVELNGASDFQLSEIRFHRKP